MCPRCHFFEIWEFARWSRSTHEHTSKRMVSIVMAEFAVACCRLDMDFRWNWFLGLGQAVLDCKHWSCFSVCLGYRPWWMMFERSCLAREPLCCINMPNGYEYGIWAEITKIKCSARVLFVLWNFIHVSIAKKG